jgi:probable rRNA maturation factor
MSELALRNRQRVRRINLRLFRNLTCTLLLELVGGEDCELCIHLVGAREMTRLNETFLQHKGSTDVITFNHANRQSPIANRRLIHGEIFICVDEAIRQARRFRTTWQSEIVRYLVHGILHLLGHDDKRAPARRRMKREENRLVDGLAKPFKFAALSRKS